MIKNIKQYSFDCKSDDYVELKRIAKKYKNIKNYIYSTFSGIGSYLIVYNHRKDIRDVWTHNDFIDQWSVSRRYVRNAIDDSIANIKTNWIQTLKDTRKDVNKLKISEAEKKFIYIMLKNKTFLFNVLNKIKFDLNGFDDIENKEKHFKTIRRLIRKNKPRISKTKKLSMQIDSNMFSYVDGKIEISSTVRGKRLKFKVNTEDKFSGIIRISFENDRIVFSKGVEIDTKLIDYKMDRIGIDKNFINCIDSNNCNSYGLNLNEKITKLSDTLYEKNKKRNKYRSQVTELKKKNVLSKKDLKTIFNINKFNLGTVKYNKEKNRLQEEMRKHVNISVNELITKESPKEIAVEELNFNGRKKYSKKINRVLSTWTKGYIQQRIDYKTELNNIKQITVNAAYTSQICPNCQHFGVKRNDMFYCSNNNCGLNGGVNSGHVAAEVILQRSYDKDITTYTPYRKVKSILQKRLEENKKPIQPRPAKSNFSLERIV